MVYRVEHELDHYGPYTPLYYHGDYKRYSLCWDLAISHSGENEHPPPSRDGLVTCDYAAGERCAFDSADKLYDWFEGWLAQLDEAGYRLSTYRVNRRYVRQGARQLVFNINKAQRVETQRLVEKAAA